MYITQEVAKFKSLRLNKIEWVVKSIKRLLKSMNKLMVFSVVLCMLLPLCSGYRASANEASPYELFVSMEGSDLSEGTITSPLRTIDGAKKKVRELKQNSAIGTNGINVILREGAYNVGDGLEFTIEDSGEINAPICYKSYENETVRVTNGVELDTSKFVRVTDKSVLERMPIEAQDKVYQINLAKEGINDYGSIVPVNIYEPYTPSSSLLIVDDDMMRIAEWPNNDYAQIKEVLSDQSEGYIFTINENRIARWKTIDDVWVYGQFMYQWADDTLKTKSFDGPNKTISTFGTAYDGISAGGKIKIINLLEELDIPGEWYLDRTTGILYLYPKNSISQSNILLSTKAKPLVTLNKAEYITFSNLIFEGTCASAILIKEGKNNLISNCEIRNIGQQAVEIIDGKRNGIERCHIHDIGKGGVSIIGGDVVNLTPSENYVENCHVERYDTIATKGSNAILLRGVGDRVSRCRIHNGSHRAIGFSGQNHIIEYNDIYDVLRDTMDAGAIYAGRSWVYGGTTIRYNFIHDCFKNSSDNGRSSIYLDDWMTDVKVYGNVMYNMNGGVALHSSQYCEVTNNMFIDCGYSVMLGNFYGYPAEKIREHNALIDGMYKNGTLKDNYESANLVCSNDLFSNYYKLYDPNNEEWNRQFPYLKTIVSDGKALSPKNDVIKKNVTFTGGGKTYNNLTPIWLSELALEDSVSENNYTTDDKAFMVDGENGNCNLADYLVVDQNVVGFERLDIKKVGIEGETSAVIKDFDLIAPINGAVNVDAKDTVLSWEEKSGAERYRLVVAMDVNFKNIVFDDIVIHNYKKFTDFAYGKQKYYWKVQTSTTSWLNKDSTQLWNENGIFTFETAICEPTVVLQGISYQNTHGDYIQDFQINEANVIQISLANLTAEAIDAQAVLKSYNGNGTVCDYSTLNEHILGYSTCKLGLGVQVSGDENAYLVLSLNQPQTGVLEYTITKDALRNQAISGQKLVIKSIALTDSSGTVIRNLQKGGLNIINVALRNIMAEDIKAIGILVVYDNNKKLLNYSLIKRILYQNIDESFGLGLTVPNEDGVYLKLFIWEDDNNIEPLYKAFKFN